MDYLEHGTSIPTTPRNSGRLPFTDIEQIVVEESGQSHACEIVDVALSGISLKATVRPAIGTRVIIGNSATVVARHTDIGFAVAFSEPRVSK